MALKFNCINCGQEIIAKYLKIGDAVKCRHCGAEMAVPENAIASDEKSTLLGVKVPDTSIADSQAKPGINTEARPKDPDYPNIAQAIWLMILTLIIIVLLNIIVGVLSAALHYRLYMHPLTNAVVDFIAILFILKKSLKRTGLNFNEVFFFRPFSMSIVFPLTISLVGIAILLSEVGNAMRFMLPPPQFLANYTENFVTLSFWGSVLGLVFVGPLAEELLFRGLFLRSFLGRFTVSKSIIVSALLFTLFHLNPWQFPLAFVIGIFLAWLFVKTKSLWPCVLGHVVMNGLVVTSVELQLKISGLSPEHAETARFQPLGLDLFALFLAGCGLWLPNRIFIKQGNHVAETNSAAL